MNLFGPKPTLGSKLYFSIKHHRNSPNVEHAIMPVGSKLKSADHHWWPKSLSKNWAADDGCVTQLSWNGRAVRLQPHKFGAIRNAHHLKRGEESPWNATFEPIFHDADSNFPNLAAWLMTLESKHANVKAPFEKRFVAQPLDITRKTELASALSSLIVRSPRSRNNIRITIESIYKADGLTAVVDKTLIAANMHASHGVFTNVINGGGKFIALVSDGPELIFGDGFLHNFPIGTDRPLNARCLIPLLPSVAVIFVQPFSYGTQPELMTMRLRENEVDFINRTIQIYSRDHIFYRSEKPTITDEFTRHEHLDFEYHEHPWLDDLLNSAIAFQ